MKEPQIIYEDSNFLVLNKPNGLLVHSIQSKKLFNEHTLVDWLVKKHPQIKNVGDNPSIRPGIVHRLDKETSGIMIVALNQETFNKFKDLFKNNKIKKTYLAMVWGIPQNKSGIIDKEIGLKNKTVKRSVYGEKFKKSAITFYKVLKVLENKYLKPISFLEIQPITGRTHQIRVHLKSIGYPICGDKLYGIKNDGFERLMLHALSLEFSLENGKILKLESELPEEFRII